MSGDRVFDYKLFGILVVAFIIIIAFWVLGNFAGGILGVICLLIIAGILGGGINALISDNGFIAPQVVGETNKGQIIRPGFVGNILVGIVAAIVSWALYGPFASAIMIGGTGKPVDVSLTFAGFGDAIIIALGGANWLTAEVDKKMLKRAAIISQQSANNSATAHDMENASPAGILDLADKSRQK